MPVLTRSSLEASPLADLHELASELELDGFRRLRKAELVDRILEVHGAGEDAEPAAGDEEGPRGTPREKTPARPRRARRTRDTDTDSGGDASVAEAEAEAEAPAPPPAREPREEATVEGVIELLGNGSGFVRVNPPDASDDDVYVSAAQVRRCELVSRDRVTGPGRSPRPSERYPSLIRVDTINGRPADEVAEGTHFDDLPATFPTERFSLLSEDPTLRAIEWLTPIGRGSRATLVGPARSGKTEALRRLAAALHGQEGLEVSVVLAGARPEEVAEWRDAGLEPTATLGLASSAEAQAQAIERAVETARRVAARGGDAVLAIDSLDAVPTQPARRTLAAA